jgi:putative endonuclease
MAEHNDLGKTGEDLALQELIAKGYQLIERNYRFGKGEIDLVMKDKNKLVFVEVKTRQTAEIGEPYLAVNIRKQRQIIQIANHYVVSKNIDSDIRFDIVSIIHNSYRTKIEHIDEAFYPTTR